MEREMISRHYKNYLGEMIKAKTNGKTVPTQTDEVFDNIHHLAEEKVSFGDERVRWLPLNTKKMLAKAMDPDSYVTYDVKRNGNIVSCEAKFYWSGSEHPAGTGFVARDVTARIRTDADATVAETEIEALVRGAAASRAYTDAGIGIEFYSDSFDTLFSSVEEAEAEEVAQRKQTAKADEMKRLVPEVPTKDEIKKKAKAVAVAKAAKAEPAAPAEMPAKEETPATEAKETATEATVETPAPTAPAAEKPAEATVTSNNDDVIDTGKARFVITTKGTLAGQPLGNIEKARPTALVWYAANNDTEEVGVAARVILAEINDPGLNERLERALNKK